MEARTGGPSFLGWLFTLLLVGSGLGGTGCGSDTPPPPPPPEVGIDIQNGFWEISQNWTTTGPDSCDLVPDSAFVDTLAKCKIFTSDNTDFRYECDEVRNGIQVTFTCTATADLDPCFQILEMSGSGTITDTTFNINAVSTQRMEARPNDLEECLNLYGSSVSPCSTFVQAVGVFVAPFTPQEQDSICPNDEDTPDLSVIDLVPSLLRPQ